MIFFRKKGTKEKKENTGPVPEPDLLRESIDGLQKEGGKTGALKTAGLQNEGEEAGALGTTGTEEGCKIGALQSETGELKRPGEVKLPPLSKRMQAVVNMVPVGTRAADIGCDHGYVAIYLAAAGICEKCIGVDVNKGPLKSAAKNVELYGAEEKVELRLGDGLQVLRAGEADAVIIAGVGGRTTVKILENSPEILQSVKTLICEPQSNVPNVRHFLAASGFCIEKEDFVREEDKFYPVICAVRSEKPVSYTETEFIYGPCLLADRHPLLKEYLERQYVTFELIHDRLNMHNGYTCVDKKMELKSEKQIIRDALSVYGEINDRDIGLRVAQAKRTSEKDRH